MARLRNAIGLIIGLLGVGFVVRELVRHWPEVTDAASGADVSLLLAAAVVGLAALTGIGMVWRLCLRIFHHEVSTVDAVYQYFVGQLGKYVPGGVWPVVGRAEMARRSGASGATAYWATVFAMGLTYLAAISVSLLALVGGGWGGRDGSWWIIAVLLPLGLLFLHPHLLGGVLTLLRRVTRQPLEVNVPSWGSSVRLLIVYLPGWIGISAATWLVAWAILGDPPDIANLVFATTLAWVVGFIAVPVPGGIGVREAVFVAAATSVPVGGIAAAIAVVSRFLFIVADVVGAGVWSILSRRGGRLAGSDSGSRERSG